MTARKRCLHVPDHAAGRPGPTVSCMALATVAVDIYPIGRPESPDRLTVHRCDDHWNETRRQMLSGGRMSVSIRRLEASP